MYKKKLILNENKYGVLKNLVTLFRIKKLRIGSYLTLTTSLIMNYPRRDQEDDVKVPMRT